MTEEYVPVTPENQVDDGLRPVRKPRSSAQQRVSLGLSARKVRGVAGETAPKNDRVENSA